MALSKKTKTWLIILGIPVVLLLGAAAFLKFYFTSERLKALLIPRIEQATGLQVAINDLSLSVFPMIALDVRGLTIANKPDFSQQPLLVLDRMVVDVKLRPLFDKRVEVNSLILEKPRLLLETNAEGLSNYSEKKASEQPVETSTAPSALSAVLLPDVRIIDGYIEMVDRRDNSRQVYNGFHVIATVDFNPSTNQARIENKTAIDNYSYGSLESFLITDWRINLDNNLVFDANTSVLKIENGKGVLNAIPFDINGTVDAKDKITMDLTVEAKNVNVAQLLNLTPKAYVEKIKGVKGDGNVNAKILIKGIYDSDTRTLPDISGNINTTNASIQYPNIPKPITNISIVSNFVKSKATQEFHIEKLTANLGQNPIAAKMDLVNFSAQGGSASGGDDPSLALNVKGSMNLAEVKDYYPLEAGTSLAGVLKADISINGKVKNPDALKAAGNMEFQNVTGATATSKNPIRDMNGALTFNNQLLESKKLTMTIGKSDLALGFTMRNYLSMMADADKEKPAEKATATVTLNSNHLFTADIMSDDKPAGGQASGASQPKNKATMPLPNIDMEIAANIGTLTTEKFEMKNVRGTMRISNGVINMNNLTMNMFDGTVATRGSLNMQNPQRPTFNMNLDLNSLKANTALSMFTSFGQRIFGDLNMNIAISGALDDTLGLVPSSLNATGSVSVNNGKVQGVRVNQQIASLVSLPDLAEINFKDWVNAFSIKDGRFNIPELKISALGGDYTIGGSHGLDGTNDLTMALLLSEAASAKVSVPGFANDVVNAIKEPNGRLKLDFFVGGTLTDPKVRLNSDALTTRAANFAKSKLDAEKAKLQQKAEEEAKKKADDLKKKGEDLLKGIFKKK